MAGYMAQWGPKAFMTTPGVVLPISDLSIQKSVKTKSQSEDNGTDKTNISGLEPESITLETKCLRAAGVDPRKQVEEWKSLMGQAYPLYIGGSRFGPAKLYLKSVDASDIMLTNSGKFLAVTIKLSFEEYHTSTIAVPKAWSSGTKSDEIKRAMSYTASAADKAAKKP